METKKHSGLGIASLIVSLATGLVVFLAVGALAVMDSAVEGGLDEESPAVVLLGLVILGSMAVLLGSLGLGVAGLFQPDRNRTTAIIGTIVSAAAFLGITALVCLGLLAG